MAPGQYVITEAAAPANWALTSIVCSEDDTDVPNGTASITVDPGDAISCTFTNTMTEPEPEPECPDEVEDLRGAFNRRGDDCPDEADDEESDERDELDGEQDEELEDAGDPPTLTARTRTPPPTSPVPAPAP